jgi:hypothetical protein
MSNDAEDPDLREAIRLSLMEANSSATTPRSSTNNNIDQPVVIDDSDDDGDEKKPTGTTKTNSSNSNKRQPSAPSSSSATTEKPAVTPSSVLGLDRRSMEQERLERLKRSAPSTSTSSDRPLKSQRSSENPFRATSALSSSNLFDTDIPSRPISVQAIGSKSGPQYPNGIVKRTYIQGGAKTSADITLDEVLQKVGYEFHGACKYSDGG